MQRIERALKIQLGLETWKKRALFFDGNCIFRFIILITFLLNVDFEQSDNISRESMSWLLHLSAQKTSKKSGCIHVKIDVAASYFYRISWKRFRIFSIWDTFSVTRNPKDTRDYLPDAFSCLVSRMIFQAGGLVQE
jgi:hypothetical protein